MEGAEVPDSEGEGEGRKKYFKFLLADEKTSLTFATLFGRNRIKTETDQSKNGAAMPVFDQPAECGGRSSLK